PWKSYRRSAKKHCSSAARENLANLRLRPDSFPALLTGEIGFSSWEDLGPPPGAVGGFVERHLQVFLK
ncbi:unnamed protein product, partial [Discosporangium mesarthrocarpum]